MRIFGVVVMLSAAVVYGAESGADGGVSIESLASGKLISSGVTGGVALGIQTPFAFGRNPGWPAAQLLTADVGVMPYLALIPAYWALPELTRTYCASSWTGDAEAEAHRRASRIAIQKAESVVSILGLYAGQVSSLRSSRFEAFRSAKDQTAYLKSQPEFRERLVEVARELDAARKKVQANATEEDERALKIISNVYDGEEARVLRELPSHLQTEDLGVSSELLEFFKTILGQSYFGGVPFGSLDLFWRGVRDALVSESTWAAAREKFKEKIAAMYWNPSTPGRCGWTKFGVYVGVPTSLTVLTYVPGEPEGERTALRSFRAIVSAGLMFAPNPYVSALFGITPGNISVGETTELKGVPVAALAWMFAIGGNIDLVTLLLPDARGVK